MMALLNIIRRLCPDLSSYLGIFFVLEGSAQEFCFGHIIVSISDIWFLNVIGSLCFFVSNECTHILKNVLEV